MKLKDYYLEKTKKWSFQTYITVSFTALIILGMLGLSLLLYRLSDRRMERSMISSTEHLMDQAALNLEEYLRNMRLISDTMYYSVIKEADLANDSISDKMNLLYEANKDNIVSLACFDETGTLVASAPFSIKNKSTKITQQRWFRKAMDTKENVQFSTPHVQNLFDNSSYRYYWVISLSRAVELNTGGKTRDGVLVIDMNYSSIEQIFSKLNDGSSYGYSYLMDNKGNLIYHPDTNMIYAGVYQENNEVAAGYEDGTRREVFEGAERIITVKTLSYTGWRIVNVLPESEFVLDTKGTRFIFALTILLTILLVLFLSIIVSSRLSRPIEEMTRSIEELKEDDPNSFVTVGGSSEIQYLGTKMNEQIASLRKLTADAVVQQEEKRKAELEALQSQIHPHFLYNTLDSIVWMIEGERYKDAIFMITSLASLFRVSLSKGKTIIPIEDELRHAQSYMNIQKVRYHNKFEIEYEIDPEIRQCQTVKLVIQPLLENALYYAIEALDGDGEIRVKGFREGDDIYIQVIDNGMGMSQDVVDQLLVEGNYVPKKGSGVGLLNVHNRIRIRFGEPYGLIIESEPDEGTCVTIHLPYQLYGEGGKGHA